MKILIVTGIYPPDIGGPATYVPQLASALLNRGHKVTVLTLGLDKQETFDDAEWDLVKISREIPLLIRTIKVMRKIFQLGSEHDAVFANGMYVETGLVLRLLKMKSIAKIVGDPVWERSVNKGHTELSISDFNSQKRIGMRTSLQRKILSYGLNSFHEITCPSAELAKFIKFWNVRRNILVIPNGVDVAPCTTSPKKYDVISISRLVKWKNIDKLIKVCAQVKLKLAIVGSGPEMENLSRIAHREKANVDFLGELRGEDIHGALCSAKVFAGISSYEGLSFSLIQAMGSGLAIVASDIPGNSDVVTHGSDGLLVNINDLTSLSEALLKLTLDKKYAQQLGKAAVATVGKKYSRETQLDQMIIRIER